MYFKAYIDTEIEIQFVTAERLSDLKDGFWINSDFNFTKVSDLKYWIPPAKILFIEATYQAGDL